MAYMRGDPYIYDDGTAMRFHYRDQALTMPLDMVDELAAMRWMLMDEEQRQAAMTRVAELHGGNFGADGVLRHLGLPTVAQQLVAAVEKLSGPPNDV